MIHLKALTVVLIILVAILSLLVAFHVINKDSFEAQFIEEAFKIDTGIDLKPIEDELS